MGFDRGLRTMDTSAVQLDMQTPQRPATTAHRDKHRRGGTRLVFWAGKMTRDDGLAYAVGGVMTIGECSLVGDGECGSHVLRMACRNVCCRHLPEEESELTLVGCSPAVEILEEVGE